MKSRVDEFKYNISEAFELPKDIVLDLPKVILIGNLELYISNHKGIIEYTQELLRINSNIGILRVEGTDLELKTILSEEIIVAGNIEKIEIIS